MQSVTLQPGSLITYSLSFSPALFHSPTPHHSTSPTYESDFERQNVNVRGAKTIAGVDTQNQFMFG